MSAALASSRRPHPAKPSSAAAPARRPARVRRGAVDTPDTFAYARNPMQTSIALTYHANPRTSGLPHVVDRETPNWSAADLRWVSHPGPIGPGWVGGGWALGEGASLAGGHLVSHDVAADEF